MRNLAEKLAAISSQQPKAARPAPTGCYVDTQRFPLDGALAALHTLPLDAVLAVDPRLPLDAFDIRRVLFLDTETTGLSGGVGTVPFLVGAGWVEEETFVLRQWVMRDYAEEPFLLSELLALLPRFDLLVTYNGKTFDLPLLLSRLVLHRMPGQVVMPEAHLDLLHPARALYKLRLTRCPLSVLEQRVLGIHREDDLPGSEVPARYFEFLKTREFVLLEDVLRHNAQDIRTLGLLLLRLCEAYTAPEQLSFDQDVLSVGRVLERRGNRPEARQCFRIASRGETGTRARQLLAGSHRRDAEFAEAERIYLEMLTRGEGDLLPYVELAKLLEHRQRAYTRALAYTQTALRVAAERGALASIPELERRKARLLRKIQKQGDQ